MCQRWLMACGHIIQHDCDLAKQGLSAAGAYFQTLSAEIINCQDSSSIPKPSNCKCMDCLIEESAAEVKDEAAEVKARTLHRTGAGHRKRTYRNLNRTINRNQKESAVNTHSSHNESEEKPKVAATPKNFIPYDQLGAWLESRLNTTNRIRTGASAIGLPKSDAKDIQRRQEHKFEESPAANTTSLHTTKHVSNEDERPQAGQNSTNKPSLSQPATPVGADDDSSTDSTPIFTPTTSTGTATPPPPAETFRTPYSDLPISFGRSHSVSGASNYGSPNHSTDGSVGGGCSVNGGGYGAGDHSRVNGTGNLSGDVRRLQRDLTDVVVPLHYCGRWARGGQ